MFDRIYGKVTEKKKYNNEVKMGEGTILDESATNHTSSANINHQCQDQRKDFGLKEISLYFHY